MDFAYLLDFELDYELKIRNEFKEEDTRETKERLMRVINRNEMIGDRQIPMTSNIELDLDFEECSKTYDEIVGKSAVEMKRYPVLYVSRARHILKRLKRLEVGQDEKLVVIIPKMINAIVNVTTHCFDEMRRLSSLTTPLVPPSAGPSSAPPAEVQGVGENSEHVANTPIVTSVSENVDIDNGPGYSGSQFRSYSAPINMNYQSTLRSRLNSQTPIRGLTSTKQSKDAFRSKPVDMLGPLSHDAEEVVSSSSSESEIQVTNRTPRRIFRSTQNLPVHKWNIRFSGDGRGLELNDFLSQIRFLSRTESVGPSELLRNAYHLFEGDAKNWVRAFYDRYNSWDDLVRELRKQFLPVDHDYWKLKEIDGRLQGKSENFGLYLAAMELHFQDLIEPVPEKAKLNTILRNMRPFYMEKLSLLTISSVRELSIHCKKIDDVKYTLEHRGGLRTNVPAGNFGLGRGLHVNELEETNSNEVVESLAQMDVSTPRPKNESRSIVCWNCKSAGHHFNFCPTAKRNIFCYRCGKEGVTSAKCSRCQSGNRQ